MERVKKSLTVFPSIASQGSRVMKMSQARRNSLTSKNTSFSFKTKFEITTGALNLDNERKT